MFEALLDYLMWTPTARAQHSHAGLRYGSDSTDAEWAILYPFLRPEGGCGRKRAWAMREGNVAACNGQTGQGGRMIINLGNALRALGKLESGTARLAAAVVAYRAALGERTRDRVPLQWAMIHNNLGTALWALGEREGEAARLEEAVAAYRAALGAWTRDRMPFDWAMTQNNLGSVLWTLGLWESGTARLEEAVAAFDACLKVTISIRPPEWVSRVRTHQDETRAEIRRRTASYTKSPDC